MSRCFLQKTFYPNSTEVTHKLTYINAIMVTVQLLGSFINQLHVDQIRVIVQ